MSNDIRIELPGDSGDYELITKGIELSKDAEGLCMEIGLRRGGGTKYIIDGIAQYCPDKVACAIDPYGNIEYRSREGRVCRIDYTNQMRDEALPQIYTYALQKRVHFVFINLEDGEFFLRYMSGIPIYREYKEVVNKYSFVHFDGPHTYDDVMAEIGFFLSRTSVGGCWVFDDVTYYNHDEVEGFLERNGFVLIDKTNIKALYKYAGFKN